MSAPRITRFDSYRAYQTKLKFLSLCCFAFAMVILGRAAVLQIFGDSRLDKLEKQQFQSRVLVQPRRGAIYDRNGENLAVNVEIQSLAANPGKIINPEKYGWILARALGLPGKDVVKRLKTKKEFVWIRRHLPPDYAEAFRKHGLFLKNGNLPEGFWLVKESERAYPHDQIAAHIIGGVNVDLDGIEGVELLYNEQLKGKATSIQAIRDALGRPAFIEAPTGSRSDAQDAMNSGDGQPITLTLDLPLQFAVERALQAAVEKHSAEAGSAIVMDAESGEILAMANQPWKKRRNRAIVDGYEPGSTMKPILMAAALEHGWPSGKLVWGEQGQFKVQGRTISEAETHEKYKWLTLSSIVQVSSNVGAAKVALTVGARDYRQTLTKFGLGAKTDIGFPGEISGVLPALPKIKPLTLATMGFGQGLVASPIQMARAYAAFANGGFLVKPTLVKSAEVPAPVHRILSKKTVDQIVQALKSTTEPPGTGVKARVEGYEIAGKTGTSQVVDPATKKYSSNHFIGSFIGFAVGVDPKLVIYVAIDRPRGVYYGGDTAAPLFREIFTAAANRFSLPLAQPDAVTVTAAAPTAPVLPASSTIPPLMAMPDAPGRMPALIGLSQREVLTAFRGHSFELQLLGFGVVKKQTPEPGQPIKEGDSIHVEFGAP